jgi:hypothetical protein
LGDVASLSRLFAHLGAAPSGPHRDVVEDRDRVTPEGAAYDAYAPRGPCRGAVVAVHGVTVNGPRDERLVHFARCLARSRVSCAVPRLPGLIGCRLDADDLDVLASVTRAAAATAGGRAGLIGFSFGASYCLVAAARADVAPIGRFVLAFGAYHSLGDLWANHASARFAEPRTEVEWDDAVYLRLVLAAGNRDLVSLPADAWREVDGLLRRYCHEATPAEKRDVFERHLRDLDLLPLATRRHDTAFAALSPAGRLGGLRCGVSLVHDPHDPTVPVAHAHAIFAELGHGAGGGRHRLLVTPLLAHVTLASALRLGDVGRLYAALGPVLAAE